MAGIYMPPPVALGKKLMNIMKNHSQMEFDV